MTIIRRNSFSNLNDRYSQKVVLIDPILFNETTEKTDFTCPICFSEIERICYCTSCKTITCSKCIESWKENSSTCPFCNRRWKTVKPDFLADLSNIQTFVQSASHLEQSSPRHSTGFYCQYCLAPVQDEKSMQDHLKTCKWVSICLDCNKLFSEEELVYHKRKCPKALIECQDCGKMIERSSFASHREHCGQIYCQECNKWYEDDENYASHSHVKPCKMCEESTNRACEGCGESTCNDCLTYCQICDKEFCSQCCFYCDSCVRHICHRCTYVQYCDSCMRECCDDCQKLCRGCDKLGCRNC